MIEELEKMIERFERNEVTQHAHIEEIIKFNYTNITNELRDVKQSIKELFQGYKENSDKIIKLSENQISTQSELREFKKAEKDYGISNSNKFQIIFKQIDSLKFIHYKLLGMGISLIAIATIIYKLITR